MYLFVLLRASYLFSPSDCKLPASWAVPVAPYCETKRDHRGERTVSAQALLRVDEWGEVFIILRKMFQDSLFKIHVSNSHCVLVLQMKSRIF